jgi:D-alanine--poly(phosphoribitol) ligase subunit 2
MTETEQGIAQFIAQEFRVDLDDIDVDTPLLSSGLIDSFATVELLLHVESLAGTRVDPDDVALENLDSVARIAAFVHQLRGE